MEGNVKVIQFHVKNRGVQGLVFVQIALGSVTGISILRSSWYKNNNCWFVPLISIKRFCMFGSFYTALLSIKLWFYETTTFSILSSRHIFTKLSAFSESSIKIKLRLHWTFFVILLTLAVICKQKLLHRIKIVQYLRNCKNCNTGQDGFRKPL